jgi:hypothetical protein
MGHHLEGGQMPSGPTHGIQVVETDAGLADCERIRGWRDLPRCDEGLEIGDGGNRQVNIIPPAGNDRISGNARVSSRLEVVQVVLSHLVKPVLAGKDRRTDEGVRIAGWITAGISGLIPGPKELAAFLAFLALESFIDKEIQSILILGEHGDRRYRTGMLKGFLRIAAKSGFE